MATDPHRQHCRRQHRILGQYLSAEAWRRGLDAIVLVRAELKSVLDLKRVKATRIKWLREDLAPWFTYQKTYYDSRAPSSINSLFLSRVPLAPHLPDGRMTPSERVRGIPADAVRVALLKEGSLDEATIIATMVQRSTGLAAPPPLEVVAYRIRRKVRAVAA